MTRQEITEFYQEHHRRLYNISLRILRDSDEAEEVMQDTILKFVTAPGNFSSPEQVSAWLARTCIHASIDWRSTVGRKQTGPIRHSPARPANLPPSRPLGRSRPRWSACPSRTA